MSAMTPDWKCSDCGDWIRDCICPSEEEEEEETERDSWYDQVM